MGSRREAEIKAAVRECVELCEECPEPLKCLDAYARSLVANGWTGVDVETFRRMGRDALVGKGRATEP